jgi:hypothetical protein
VSSITKLTLRLLSVVVLAGTLSGCIIVERGPGYYPHPYWPHYGHW